MEFLGVDFSTMLDQHRLAEFEQIAQSVLDELSVSAVRIRDHFHGGQRQIV